MKSILLILKTAILLSGTVNSLSVNVTRIWKNDKFTNPNRTAVVNCTTGYASTYLDTCKTFNSTDTRAVCYSSCCEVCWCKSAFPTYLTHLGRCVSLSELNSDIFGQGSNGCGARLDENRNDVCDNDPWIPPVSNLWSSKFPLILFCRHDDEDDIASCSVTAARNSGYDQWKNISYFKESVWVMKNRDEFYFQWNRTAMSHMTGKVIIINIVCKQKKGKPDYPACFVLRSAGTDIVTPPPLQSTTTTTTSTSITTTTAIHSTTERLKTSSNPEISKTTSPTGRKTTSLTENPENPSDFTNTRTAPRSPGKDKVSNGSRDGGGTTVIVVAVICTLLVVAVLSVVTICFFRKRKRSKEAAATNQSNIQLRELQSTERERDKPDDHVYQGQNDCYQLLRRDGKPTGGGQWEPPSYQGLTKGTTEGAWEQGAVYTNPSMYQALTKNEARFEENLPGYHPLVKPSTKTPQAPAEYECGYLELIGDHDKMDKTADNEENPYYHKLEQEEKETPEVNEYECGYLVLVGDHDKMEKTADNEENPYYHKLEQKDKVTKTSSTENPSRK